MRNLTRVCAISLTTIALMFALAYLALVAAAPMIVVVAVGSTLAIFTLMDLVAHAKWRVYMKGADLSVESTFKILRP